MQKSAVNKVGQPTAMVYVNQDKLYIYKKLNLEKPLGLSKEFW